MLQVSAPYVEIYFYCVLCEKQEFLAVCVCVCVCVCEWQWKWWWW